MFDLYETHWPLPPSPRGTFATLEAARVSMGEVLCMEEDRDHPGTWDAINTRGQLFTVKRKP